MSECQSLLQTSHLCVVSGRMELLPSFLRARLSATAAISFSAPVSRCCFRALLHSVRSAARPSQDIVSMSTAFMSLQLTRPRTDKRGGGIGLYVTDTTSFKLRDDIVMNPVTYQYASNWPIYRPNWVFSWLYWGSNFGHNCGNIYLLTHEMDSDCSETSLNGFVDF